MRCKNHSFSPLESRNNLLQFLPGNNWSTCVFSIRSRYNKCKRKHCSLSWSEKPIIRQNLPLSVILKSFPESPQINFEETIKVCLGKHSLSIIRFFPKNASSKLSQAYHAQADGTHFYNLSKSRIYLKTPGTHTDTQAARLHTSYRMCSGQLTQNWFQRFQNVWWSLKGVLNAYDLLRYLRLLTSEIFEIHLYSFNFLLKELNFLILEVK